MSDTPASEASATGFDALSSSGDSLVGMATLGKTAAALALVIVIILVCTALLRRWGGHSQVAGRHLQVVASTALGGRERLVIVEIDDTWLVLGVGGGQVTKLHELPAPAPGDATPEATATRDTRFATRFARALRNNAGLGGSGRGES